MGRLNRAAIIVTVNAQLPPIVVATQPVLTYAGISAYFEAKRKSAS
jgi:hypothetical protein